MPRALIVVFLLPESLTGENFGMSGEDGLLGVGGAALLIFVGRVITFGLLLLVGVLTGVIDCGIEVFTALDSPDPIEEILIALE